MWRTLNGLSSAGRPCQRAMRHQREDAMSKSKDVIEVALKAGADVAMRAEGGPAKIVAYGAAALLTAAGVGVAYAAYLTARSGWHRFFPAGAAQPAFTEPAVNAVEAD